jgi:hypothetical protein
MTHSAEDYEEIQTLRLLTESQRALIDKQRATLDMQDKLLFEQQEVIKNLEAIAVKNHAFAKSLLKLSDSAADN